MTAPPQNTHYDLYLVAGGRRFFWRNNNHGVTLLDDRLRWTAEGRDDEAPFADIVEVRMLSGGDWRNALNQCQVTFRNGMILTVTDGSDQGLADEAKTPVYRGFARELHRRLIATGAAPQIRFIAGYGQGQYMLVMASAGLLGLMAFGAPFLALVMTGKLAALFGLVGSAFVIWPLWSMVNNNAPRGYNAHDPPRELME